MSKRDLAHTCARNSLKISTSRIDKEKIFKSKNICDSKQSIQPMQKEINKLKSFEEELKMCIKKYTTNNKIN